MNNEFEKKPLNFKTIDSGTASFRKITGSTNRTADISADWIIGYKETKIGKTPVIKTALTSFDILGGWKVRWGISRMNYKIEPGLYCTGNPDENSPVIVTANYKLTFDKVRKELSGAACWILILDTKGVNVWCAAGKGTFGTAELVSRIQKSRIAFLISHNNLILPQLGAVGVSAHEVAKSTGLHVIYGPVRASDLKLFIANKFHKTVEMTTVFFPLSERMAVAPMEIVHSLKYLSVIFLITGSVSLFQHKAVTSDIIISFLPFFGAMIAGAAVFPALLPYLPFRSFALKGYILGLLYTLSIVLFFNYHSLNAVFNFLLLPPIVSFLALNFTGASTYTSLTGTKLEVTVSLPVMALSAAAGIVIKGLILAGNV